MVGSHYCPLYYFSNYLVHMGKLTAKQVIAYSKADPKKYSDGEGLYFCVRKQGSPYWMIRYTVMPPLLVGVDSTTKYPGDYLPKTHFW